MKQSEFEVQLRDLTNKCYARLPMSICRRMEAIDWQNTLCEMDKFSRVLLGEGRPKQKYPGV